MRVQSITKLANLLISVSFAGSVAQADPINFDFNDPKKVNAIAVALDSELEPIIGYASGISGIIAFDPAEPAKISGKITVDTNSLQVSNKKMTQVMLSEDWLDAGTHPSITLDFKRVTEVTKIKDNYYELNLVGDFHCKGVTKPITIVVSAAYLADKLSVRGGGEAGDLLILRSNFQINRKEFDIKPGMDALKVAELINIQVAITGSAPK